MNEQEFQVLSAAHALHSLSPDEEAVFAEALAAHPEWRSIVEQDRETVAAIGESIGEVPPPASARNALLDVIATTPQWEPDPQARSPLADQGTARVGRADAEAEAAHEQPQRAQRSRRRRAGWFALAASLTVILALSITPWMRETFMPQDPVQVALAAVEQAPDSITVSAQFDQAGRATLHWSASEDRAILVAEGFPDLEKDRDFEVWIVRDDTPISLGVMKPEPGKDVAMIAEGFEAGDALAVTVEDQGGSPSGVPTSDPILVIASA